MKTDDSVPGSSRRFQRSAATIAVGLMALLWSAAAYVSAQNRPQQRPAQQQQATGVIAGTVTADRGEVRAFRVRVKDTAHGIAYTVYTNKGQYKVYNLPAGAYEVRVVEPDFDSPLLKTELSAGATQTVNVALTAKPQPASNVELVEYDVLYPPEPGRVLLEQNCFGCHGYAGWHNRGGKTEEGWAAAFKVMYDNEAWLKRFPGGGTGIKGAPALEHVLSEADKQTIVKYLAKHFPPNHPRRDWALDPLIRDEEALSSAIHIQYEYPPADGPEFTGCATPGACPGGLGGAKPTLFLHDSYPSKREPGVLWVSNMGSGSIMRIDTRNPTASIEARTREFRIPTANNINAMPHGIVEFKSKIYTANLADDTVTEFDSTTGKWQTYKAPSQGGGGHSLYADSKGNIYYSTVYGRSRINRVDAVTKKVTEYNPFPGANWYGVVPDKQDRIWAVGYGAMRAIAMFDPPTEKWTFYPTTYPNRRLTIDPAGNVWAVQWFGNRVAKVDAVTKQVSEYVLPLKNGSTYEVWSDKDGVLWLDVRGRYNSLVRFDPKAGTYLYIPYPEPNTQVPKYEFDAEGTLWDAGFGGSRQLRAFKMKGNVPK